MNIKSSVKKVLIGVFICIILIAILIYTYMFISTNSVVNYVEKVFKGEINSSKIKGTPLEDYNIIENYDSVDRVEIDINRNFVWHNFKDGYIYVKYTCYGYNNSEKEETYGSVDVHSTWKIHKENGEWKIVDINDKLFE